MVTAIPGGVIRGYCAIGREYNAIPPTKVMTTESTVAKMGRSMKKREIMAGAPPQRLVVSGGEAVVFPVSGGGGGVFRVSGGDGSAPGAVGWSSVGMGTFSAVTG